MKIHSLSIMLALAAATSLPVAAEDFDLSTQRGEVQVFNKVPGHKINHTGAVINPTPHEITRQNPGTILNASAGFKVADRKKAFTDDLGFLRQSPKGVKLNIDFGPRQAAKAGVKPVSGAYRLIIGNKDVSIVGHDERGAFYGLQTLRQILEHDPEHLEAMTVNDWPDLPYRGVVEGFYGTPWSHEVRLSLIDFYGRNKMNDYIYGPKDDPYHSSPYWRQPYPADQAAKIKELVEASKRARVNFVWAIHPGKDIRWDRADYDSLVNKLEMMYDLGVRSFALFFDDIDGIGTDPARQAKLVNDLTDDFVVRKGDVTNLMICPTDYSQLWAKPGPEGPLAIYGRDLNPKAEVFWTGAVVCSDLTRETLDFVNSRIKRPALFWWNYPVSDYCRNIILQGPVYGLDTTLTSAEVAGIESNPMEHGEASKLALYGVADYTWNQAAYNPIDNWERGLRYMTPEAADAYRTFAIHNCDTETGYRRDESWETETFHYNDYTQEQFDALRAEFERVAAAPSQLRAKAGNNLLLGELAPWLTEFEKLGQRGLRTLDLIKTYESGNDSLFWCNYVANIMTPQQRAEYQAHKTGTMKLHPFYENAMDHMPADFFGKLTGEKANVHRAIGSYPNLPTTLQKLMLDGDTATHYTSAQSQSEGDWIGIDAGKVINVEEITILQGRNSVDDVDYFDHAILEASADGQTWTALSEPLVKTYEIRYSGEPVQARYVRLRRLPSEKKNWASVRVFEVNPPSAQRIGMDITAADSQTALRAFDSNPASTYVNNGVLSFTPRKDAKEMIMLMADIKTAVIVTQLDKAGHVLTSSAITTPYGRINLAPQTVKVTVDGPVTIHEIILR